MPEIAEVLQIKKTPLKIVERKFVPKGAIAFFILLVLLGMAIWFGIYYIMYTRN